MPESSNLSPMFRQYRALKQQQPESILLFRMGDFYEMFFEDAQQASPILELTLTARGKGTDNVVPMCGFPHHQLDHYTGRLVQARHKVSICDQVEDPKKAKGLVRREIVRVVTPGTVNDPQQMDSKANLWIASIASSGERLGAAFLDASTGEFLVWETDGRDARDWSAVAERLTAFGPREIVFAEDLAWDERLRASQDPRAVLTPTDPFAFSSATAATVLERHFGVASLDGFGLRNKPGAIAAAAGLLQYVQETQRSRLEHVDHLLLHEPRRFLLLDEATRRNLELERSLRNGAREGSLFHAVDSTVTAAGGRLQRNWLLEPLLDPAEIGRRHDAVARLVEEVDRRERARDQLRGVHDIERLLSRTVAGTAGARDLLGLRLSLERLPGLIETVTGLGAELVDRTLAELDPCGDVAELIGRGLVDEPPATLRYCGVIRDGHDAETDRLRRIPRDGKT